MRLSQPAWRRLRKESVLFLDIFGFIFAALPALPPVTDEEFEAECVDLHAGLKANAQVPKVHLVLIGVGKEQAEMACDGEKKIIFEG